MKNYTVLVPAFGRDYKSKKEVLADWNAEKDFMMAFEGCYINKPQVPKGITVNIRYANKTKVLPVKC